MSTAPERPSRAESYEPVSYKDIAERLTEEAKDSKHRTLRREIKVLRRALVSVCMAKESASAPLFGDDGLGALVALGERALTLRYADDETRNSEDGRFFAAALPLLAKVSRDLDVMQIVADKYGPEWFGFVVSFNATAHKLYFGKSDSCPQMQTLEEVKEALRQCRRGPNPLPIVTPSPRPAKREATYPKRRGANARKKASK